MTLAQLNSFELPDWAVPSQRAYYELVGDGLLTEHEFLKLHRRYLNMVWRLDQRIINNRPKRKRKVTKSKMIETECTEWTNQHEDSGNETPEAESNSQSGGEEPKVGGNKRLRKGKSKKGKKSKAPKITKFIHKKTPYGPPPRSDEEVEDSSEDSEDGWTPPTQKKSKKKK